MSIPAALSEVRARIESAARAAGRDPTAVKLIAVSKTQPAEAVREAYAAGLRTAGVEVLDDRYPTMIHGFFSMTTTTKVAGEALDRAAEQLRAALA